MNGGWDFAKDYVGLTDENLRLAAESAELLSPRVGGLMGWVESALIDALYGLLADEEEKRALTILAWRRMLWAQMTAFMEACPQPAYLSENLHAA